MRQILEKDSRVRHGPCTHQLLVHVGLPCEALHIRVATDADESLPARVAAVPEALHDAENPEYAAMRAHEFLAGEAQVPPIAACEKCGDCSRSKTSTTHR